METFGTVLNQETELSDTDFEVLLLYLYRDKGAIAYDGKVCDSSPPAEYDIG